MGNSQSSPPKSSRRSKKKKDTETDVTQSAFGDFTSSIQSGMRKIEDSTFLDQVCGTLMDEKDGRTGRSNSYGYSDDFSEGSRTLSEDDTLDEYDRRRKHGKNKSESENESMMSEYDTVDTYSEQSKPKKKSSKRGSRRDSHEDSESFMTEDSSVLDSKKGGSRGVVTESTPEVGLSKPLASSFAKRCYFTKAGIGKTTQHYEGLTLTGNVVLMLAGAMKLKGCPTICDEDLRRVEQTYPNQFSRLPDELLLSSGWRRISKYCHFSNKPIPDGVPFFHSKQRIHPTGGYYFLLAAAVGMIRSIDVEPLTRDTLVLLETDYPTQCDAAPDVLIEDPTQWTLVDKFCFFSGGPINTEEDVYYQADFDGNLIFMLAFLSPSLTPEELYKLGPAYEAEPGLKSTTAVEEVESVYDLTERDFDDLKLYHLGPCRALPPYILQPGAWTKVLPPHFLAAKQQAMMIALEYEQTQNLASPSMGTANSSAQATETVTSSGAAVGTINSTDAVLPQPPPEVAGPAAEAAYSPPAQEAAYSPPAQEAAPVPAEDVPYPPESQYPPVEQSTSHAVTPQSQPQSYAFDPSTRNVDGSFLREVEEEGAFVDSTIPIDEAIDARRKKRGSKHRSKGQMLSEEPRGPGSMASSGYVVESEAGTSFTGSSYVDPPPGGEPPSLAPKDCPDDEGVYEEDEYTEPVPEGDYIGEDGRPYDTSGGEVRNPAGAPNGYYHDGEYYQSNSRDTGGSSEYYEREEEYYDSPEKGNLRVHTALEQHGDFGQSPDQGSSPGFIYSQETGSDFSGGPAYRSEDGGYDESRGNSHLGDHVYSPNGESYDSPVGNKRTGEPNFTRADDESFESPENYARTASSPVERAPQERRAPAPSGFRSTRPNSLISPTSEYSVGENTSASEYSQTSAMRGAQELLRKNRQKRLEMAMRKQNGGTSNNRKDDVLGSPERNKDEEDDVSATTSFVSGSSVWTDSSAGADRGSRRALILQMAKARMKSNKTGHPEGTTPIAEEPSMVESGEFHEEEESKTSAPTKVSDMSLTAELD